MSEGGARALDVEDSVELARIERSGLVESRHIGAAAVMDADGTVLRAVGDVSATIYPRSTLKPLQAVAMLRAGAQFTDVELVLAVSSHCGSPEHVAIVERMLAHDGRNENSLQCPPLWPLGSEQRASLQAAALGPSRLTNNCSGKHAGLLRASDALGADAGQYLETEHPVQELIRDVVAEFTAQPLAHLAVDGCGAPMAATSLAGLARGIARLTRGDEPEARRVMEAVLAEPWAIDGAGRANTVVIERLGALAKLGTEGLVVIGTREGVAVAVKVLDGSMRATTPVALTLLASVGAIDGAVARELIEETSQRVHAGGREIGRLTVSAF
ncbi:asparaginase [Microcella sp.]|uniref:asparaginase n=1 Tax=Microcella sp. TaxID=1913979 RepID=UPI00255DB7B2|nr:asparaginase [Microcella sp.]MBX9471136.1 asparaginase [Microcella sp.]